MREPLPRARGPGEHAFAYPWVTYPLVTYSPVTEQAFARIRDPTNAIRPAAAVLLPPD